MDKALQTRSHPLRRLAAPDVRSSLGRRKWTLLGAGALLCSGVAVAALPYSPSSDSIDEGQWRALSIAPLARGGRTGMKQHATAAVEHIAVAPERQQLDFALTYSGAEPFGAMLMRAGASYGDAASVHRMVGRIAPGTPLRLVLGPKGAQGRTVMRVELAANGRKLRITRGADGLTLSTEMIAVDRTPIRIRGRAGTGLYWALRSAGASPQAAAEYLRALSGELDVGSEIGPNDSFDLVVSHAAPIVGPSREGPLLYAGLQRLGGKPLQLVRWQAGGRTSWINPDTLDQPSERSGGMMWPTTGRFTSGFGYRRHPILGYSRLHAGIDIAAPTGTPIVAAAAGQVTAAGWAGGSGRLVRISHGGGIATSYAHMSAIVAEPGSFVRQGQVIGYVGSSGLSTGAHLHYSVYVSGQPVNPMTVRISAPVPVDTRQISAVRQRLKALLSVGSKRA